MLIGFALLVASVVAVSVAYQIYRRAHVSRGWHIFTVVAAVISALVVGIVAIGNKGLLVGLAAVLFTVAADMYMSSERWKGKQMFREMAESRLAENPALREAFGKNRLLRWSMRKSGVEKNRHEDGE